MASVVSLFSGGGGLDLGFIDAGFQIIWANDFNADAVSTYKRNIGNHIHLGSISEIALDDIPNCDVVIGGPPCQSFSLIGKRQTEDERGQLVWRFIDVISHIRPRVFVFENVIGLVSAKNSRNQSILNQLKAAFRQIGYSLSTQIMNAADYGVPQLRRRVFIIGSRSSIPYSFPTPTHSELDNLIMKRHITVQEAIGDLPPAAKDRELVLNYQTPATNHYQRALRCEGGVTEHSVPQMSELDKYIIQHVKPGGNYMDIPPEVESKRIRRLQITGGHTTCYGRMLPDKPSYTINTYFNRPNVGCNIHYSENRLITVREALRLQSFPDSYQLVTKSKQAKHQLVGNAVPPILARAIAEQLKLYLEVA